MTFFQGIVIFFNLSLFLLLFSYFLFGLQIPKTDEECFVGVSKLGLALYKHSANMVIISFISELFLSFNVFYHFIQDLLASYRFGYELRHYTNDGEAIEIKVKPARHDEDRVLFSFFFFSFYFVLTILSFFFQTVVIVSLRFSEIIDLLSYYEKNRKLDKELNNQE